MGLTDDEIVLATAARFLFESGKDDEANLLLNCSLMLEEEEAMGGIRYAFILTAPTSAYAILSQDRDPVTIEIRNALYSTVPKPSFFFGNAFTHRFNVVVGYPD